MDRMTELMSEFRHPVPVGSCIPSDTPYVHMNVPEYDDPIIIIHRFGHFRPVTTAHGGYWTKEPIRKPLPTTIGTVIKCSLYKTIGATLILREQSTWIGVDAYGKNFSFRGEGMGIISDWTVVSVPEIQIIPKEEEL